MIRLLVVTDYLNNILQLLIRQGREHGQTDLSFVESLGLREVAGLEAEGLPIVRHQMQRDVVHLHEDAASTKVVEEVLAPGGVPHTHREQVIGVQVGGLLRQVPIRGVRQPVGVEAALR